MLSSIIAITSRVELSLSFLFFGDNFENVKFLV
jgi:hypothetical protein